MSESRDDIANQTLQDIIRARKGDKAAAAKILALRANQADFSQQNDNGWRPITFAIQDPAPAAPDPDKDIHKSLDTIIQERGIKHPDRKPVTAFNSNNNVCNNDGKIPCPSSQMKSPPKQVTLRQLDPCSHSLDEMIIREKPSTSAEPSQGGKRKREDGVPMEVDGDKLKSVNGRLVKPALTPCRAVSFLSEAGMMIELKIGKLAEVGHDKSHLWRCEVACGTIKGVCDSIRKVVAREMASHNFLTILKESFPEGKIPKYQVPPELLIDPKVFHRIEKIATEKAITVCHEVRIKQNEPKPGRSAPWCTYICNYYVGTNKSVGESNVVEYSKLIAAKQAYEYISGEPLLPTAYFVGEDCPANLEYNFNESEVFHILSLPIEGQDDFPFQIDSDEAKRELARRKLYQDFKKSKTEDVQRRRNMPVNVSPSTSSAGGTENEPAKTNTNPSENSESNDKSDKESTNVPEPITVKTEPTDDLEMEMEVADTEFLDAVDTESEASLKIVEIESLSAVETESLAAVETESESKVKQEVESPLNSHETETESPRRRRGAGRGRGLHLSKFSRYEDWDDEDDDDL